MYNNEFQVWLHKQGYYRKDKSLLWYKENDVKVSGKELHSKLMEWRKITGKQHPDKN